MILLLGFALLLLAVGFAAEMLPSEEWKWGGDADE